MPNITKNWDADNNVVSEKTYSRPVIIIRPPSGAFYLDLRELWSYRELAFFFVWRDIKIRYKQTIMGAMWAVFQPFFAMVVFTVFFGKLAKMPSDGIPYPVFVYVGLLLWNYFAFGLAHASNSMISNSNIIQKIYFPRLIIPLASSLIGLIDFAVASVILAMLMVYYSYVPNFSGLVYVPFLLLIAFFSSLGIGSILASLNVKYRDVQYIIPFFIQMMMFLTPVIYPASIVGSKYRWILSLNPMTAVIETARAAIFGNSRVDIHSLCISGAVSLFLFIFGVVYFRKTERYFADII
ncbi:MAG: ABC transporter permease [Candidatus Omnitrophota bacterium]